MKIVPRSEWRARPAKSVKRIAVPTSEVWLHHTAGSEPDGWTGVKRIQDFHMNTRGWSDIAYSFVVDRTGEVFEGRGAGIAGAHTQGRNSVSHAICVVGNYENEVPTEESINAVAWLLRHGAQNGWWRKPVITGGHRDAPQAGTACPGRHLYRRIPEINSLADGGDMDEVAVKRVVKEALNEFREELRKEDFFAFWKALHRHDENGKVVIRLDAIERKL